MNRKPRDTDIKAHDILNRLSKERFGWEVRNAMFATTSFDVAKSYTQNNSYTEKETEVYLFIPIGEFDFAYSIFIDDLYNVLESNPVCSFPYWSKVFHDGEKDEMIVKEWITKRKEFLSQLIDEYETTDLVGAVDVEVSFKCEYYYLVDIRYTDLIKKLIKGGDDEELQ